MGGDESKSTRVRWLNAARYAIAAVVTVLTIGVIAWAIVLSVRPELLEFRVVYGNVTVGKIESLSPPVSVGMSLTLEAINYGGRADISYHNVSVHFLYHNSSEITYIYTEDIFVPPQFQYRAYVRSTDLTAPDDVGMDFVRRMLNGSEISDATMRLEGTILTQTSVPGIKRRRLTTYDCYPVTIGTSSAAGKDDDVPCTARYS
uniref:Uncharacterized protein n=1 Tax=Avena sativa TaxID=4498 RepID=A0ACD5VMD1_AVESA